MRLFAVAGLVAAAMPQTWGVGVVREKIVGLLRAGDASALRNISPVVETVSGDPIIEEEVERLVRQVCARDEDGGGADVLEAALSSYRAPPPAAAEVLVRAACSGPPGGRRAAIREVSRVGGGLWAWHTDAALAALVHAASEEEGVAEAGRRGAELRVDVRGTAIVGLRRMVGASLQRGDGRAGRAPRDGGSVLQIARGELRERRALAVCLASLPRQAGGCLFALLHVDVVRMVVVLASV